MYWLLTAKQQKRIRNEIDALVRELSNISGNPQIDQLFPYVGRKDRRKALSVIKHLTEKGSVVVDPFVGSGVFVYAACQLNRKCLANEWEPYAFHMASAPWRLPAKGEVDRAREQLLTKVRADFDYYYKTKCICGRFHVLDTLFYDRKPLRYKNVTPHERLGPNGENITYRMRYKCPHCGATEKHFSSFDAQHMKEILNIPLSRACKRIFKTELIENSRINLSKEFTIYGNLFPHRSKIALCELWDAISALKYDRNVKSFLVDAFLSILPQAKYKDYRSKSQDIHCPDVQLREVNILYRFIDQLENRYAGLKSYSFAATKNKTPITCSDFRAFLKMIRSNYVELVLTDPPWTDGNAYFEKAQLYHPWLGYSLKDDSQRLDNELVVTDAPSRRNVHNEERWWQDIALFFAECYRVLKHLQYLALFFRPIPASQWLKNLNNLKLAARKAGLEPLLSIDVASSDPSMRIQQSASYVFSQDVIMVFVKLPEHARRFYFNDLDIDQIAFQTAEELQESKHGHFVFNEWRKSIAEKFNREGAAEINKPKYEKKLYGLFQRYCDEISPGNFLPKPLTPFSGQLFDVPAIERLFTYIPHVINELTKENEKFSYDGFLLRLSEYVENGTRMLIEQIQHINIKKMIEPYAEPIQSGRWFQKRRLPKLPKGLKNILELGPYEFEAFIGNLLEAQGFTSVALVGRAGDRGVDLTANDSVNNLTVIQCKRYFAHKVASAPVQRLHSFAVTRGASRKILITTSGFTRQAKDEARLTNTELIEGRELDRMTAKYLPDYFK